MIKRLSIAPVILIVAALGLIGLHFSLNGQALPQALLAATLSATVRTSATVNVTLRPTLSPSPAITRTPSPAPSQTPLATLTASQTLLPPPTFEPPTQTPPASPLPSLTPTFTPIGLGLVPGLLGAETATPDSTPGCVIRKDWKLTYTVQFNDALINIAKAYSTNVNDLVAGNCLSDANKIYLGEVLHVPGTLPPSNAVQCFPLQVLTPLNNTFAIPGSGSMEFHWYGPRTPRSLIRVFAPDGTKTEYVIDLRQDESVDLTTLPQSGTFTWYVYPLDQNFLQDCPEGGPWTFTKAAKPTPTATSAALTGGIGTGH